MKLGLLSIMGITMASAAHASIQSWYVTNNITLDGKHGSTPIEVQYLNDNNKMITLVKSLPNLHDFKRLTLGVNTDYLPSPDTKVFINVNSTRYMISKLTNYQSVLATGTHQLDLTVYDQRVKPCPEGTAAGVCYPLVNSTYDVLIGGY